MVDSMDGCLIAAIGQKVFIHDLNENDIRATGFVDTQIYTHCSQTFKHFCLVGDIQQARVVHVNCEIIKIRFSCTWKDSVGKYNSSFDRYFRTWMKSFPSSRFQLHVRLKWFYGYLRFWNFRLEISRQVVNINNNVLKLHE